MLSPSNVVGSNVSRSTGVTVTSGSGASVGCAAGAGDGASVGRAVGCAGGRMVAAAAGAPVADVPAPSGSAGIPAGSTSARYSSSVMSLASISRAAFSPT